MTRRLTVSLLGIFIAAPLPRLFDEAMKASVLRPLLRATIADRDLVGFGLTLP